jgi:hypothetical protein
MLSGRAGRFLMTTPRAFPRPSGGMRGRRGHCAWCGDGITTLNASRRGWHDGRDGEPDCLLTFFLHTRPAQQYAHVAARDGEVCWDCKGAPLKVVRGQEVWTYGDYERPQDWRDWHGDLGPKGAVIGQLVGRYCQVEIKIGLEIEHEMPLWLVAHLPDEERRPYFGPGNLRLRCTRCHKAKTKREAGERAKGNRLIAGPRVRKGRKIESRGFSKEHRPFPQSRGFR